MQREHVVMLAGENFITSLRDEFELFVAQPFPVMVGGCRCFSQRGVGRIISRGIRSLPMLKCSSERCVCAPHSLSAATLTSPRLSVSLRKVPLLAVFVVIALTPSLIILFHRSHFHDAPHSCGCFPCAPPKLNRMLTPMALLWNGRAN